MVHGGTKQKCQKLTIKPKCLPNSNRLSTHSTPSNLYRIINVIGDPIDERGPIATDKRQPIHAEAPEFVEMSVEQEILVTGIKVWIGLEVTRISNSNFHMPLMHCKMCRLSHDS